MGFLTAFEADVAKEFVKIVDKGYDGLMPVFKGAFAAGLGVWVMLIAYETAWGKSEDGLTYAVTKVARVFIIGVLALYGWPEVVELMRAIQQGLMEGLGGKATMGGVLEEKLIDPLLATFKELWTSFIKSLAAYGLTTIVEAIVTVIFGIMVFFAFLAMAIIVAALCIISFAIYFVAFAGFNLMLALGSFFLLCLAFPFTQKYFENWIGGLMTAALAMAMAALLATMASDFLSLKPMVPAEGVNINFRITDLPKIFLAKAVVGALLIYLYTKIFDYASQLGGGLNIGNNMYGAMRSIANDLRKGRGPSPASAAGGGKGSPGARGADGAGAGSGAAARAAQGNRQYDTMAAAALAAGGRGSAAAGRFAYQRGVKPAAAAARSGAVAAGQATARGAVAAGQATARGAVAVGRAAYAGGQAAARSARAIVSRGIPGITS